MNNLRFKHLTVKKAGLGRQIKYQSLVLKAFTNCRHHPRNEQKKRVVLVSGEKITKFSGRKSKLLKCPNLFFMNLSFSMYHICVGYINSK